MHFQADSTNSEKVVCKVSRKLADTEKIVIEDALASIATIVE